MAGRFAPSPTGPLHVGNLRTALLAWLVARAEGRRFVVRMEDLDRVTSSAVHEADQLADLVALGLDWDGEVVRQSERFALYEAALGELRRAGLTYECYCTRREIREAASAPHGSPAASAYPGTCRRLSETARARRRRERSPALRLHAELQDIGVVDRLQGRFVGAVHDIVLRRNDGVPAYHLAVVVDDELQGVTDIVRGADLLGVTPSQVLLQRLLGFAPPAYAHVPLVVGGDGQRLAKRDGAVTLADLARDGVEAARVRSALAASLGLAVSTEELTAAELVEGFDLEAVRAVGAAPVSVDDLRRSWS